MRFSLAGVFADAGALWRQERELLLALAGPFFCVPMLGIILLLAASGFSRVSEAEQMRAFVSAFYNANLVPILLANLTMDFGTFAVLNLLLQGGGRTLGEVLGITLRRFVPFLAIDILAGMLFGLGASLFVLPGLFAFARTWLVAPAYAAAPEKGVIEAARQGWRRSRGFAWLILLAAAGLTLIAAVFAVGFASSVLGLAHALLGGDRVLGVFIYLVAALIAGLAWTALAVVRVAAYRRADPRRGM